MNKGLVWFQWKRLSPMVNINMSMEMKRRTINALEATPE